jgi:NADH-quinone oxidoreductase subunit M
MFQKVFYGPITNPDNSRLKDIKLWEVALCAPIVVLIFWGGFFPNTFLKPMEASLNATRMMALNPSDQRPLWSDLTLEIGPRGELIRVEPRTRQQVAATKPTLVEVVAEPDFHFSRERRKASSHAQAAASNRLALEAGP